MAYLSEDIDNPLFYTDYPDVIRLEVTNRVYGGKYTTGYNDQGISNLQAMQLMERDNYILSRIGQASIEAAGDDPGKPGIAGLGTDGKVPDEQLQDKVVRKDDAQTLTNKTIDAKNNTILCTATSITATQTVTPTKQMMITVDTASIILTLGSGPYTGYELPVLAQQACNIAYVGADGAALDDLDAGSYITYVWQGAYWIVDAATYDKPTYISADTTLEPKKKLIVVIDTSAVVLTLDVGPYDGFELPVLCQDDCSIVYEGLNGTITLTCQAGDYYKFVWNSEGTGYWLPRGAVAITGIDDNGQPFAFNIDNMVHYDGIINITGKDANGNPFDYGLGRLVTNADEDNLVTGVEVKTSKTFNGKPVYKNVVTIPMATITTEGVCVTLTTQFATGIKEIISCQGYLTHGTDRVQIPYIWQGGSSTYTVSFLGLVGYVDGSNNGNIVTSGNRTTYSGNTVTAFVSYTKTTD